MRMEKERTILHCDLNNFYASAECLTHPEWRDVPLVVAGSPEKRHGVVLAKNELAKKAGIKTGDAIWQAKEKAPSLMAVEPHFALYTQLSKQVFEIYTRYTSQVEPFGPDECWLDLTESLSLFGSGEKVANEIRETVKREAGLTVSVGVSFNKTFAKMGSDLKKPDATTVISREDFRRMLWPLPVSDMLMVGKKTAKKLNALNIFSVGDLARADEALLSAHFGIVGVRLKKNANGEDDESVHEVNEKEDEKSMGQGMTTARDLTTYEDAETLILYLADKVATRLRAASLRGYGVSLSLRAADFSSLVRQKTLSNPTCAAKHIAEAAKELLHANWKCDYPLRTLTVSVYDLTKFGAVQMDMFSAPPDKAEKLEYAIDAIRQKYGEGSIMRAGIFGLDFIVDKK